MSWCKAAMAQPFGVQSAMVFSTGGPISSGHQQAGQHANTNDASFCGGD
jgi:hypothetical protein